MYLYEDVYIYVYTDLVSFRDSYWTAAGGGGESIAASLLEKVTKRHRRAQQSLSVS